ncbi:MAG TPA: NAD-dependent epimerase/dehydratase family protein, partial [Caulobacteraceae bacterium]
QAGVGAPWRRTILRFQNVYGPGQSLLNPYTGVLSIFTRQLADGGELDIYEDGEIVRDFVYVDDVVDALIAARAVREEELIVNIGSGRGTSILEAAHELARIIGRPTSVARVTGDFRPGDVRYAVADVGRATVALDWRPRTDFPTGARALVKWALAEQD